MTLIFHDLKSIIEVFLHHPYHLRLVFERCRHYSVILNPHKCIFCMNSGRLLGFIVSKVGIRVDPLKVEAILQLSPPKNIRHLQCLQGMENFLRIFVVNFANLTRGFMRLLKDTPFCWDERAQDSFDALKRALTSAPVISPPEYSHDFIFYVATSMETIRMVLVQEDEELQEHVIYYLIWNLIDTEIRYSHVEKLALATIHAIQRLRDYILLRQTLLVSHVNPFQFILTRRMIGGKYNKWIVIL